MQVIKFSLAFFLIFCFNVLKAQIPEGFKAIFNGKNLEGWHISRTTHHGTTPDCRVEDGAIVIRQHPFGQGGVLLTDKKYKNFEMYLEAKIDSMSNGGIFIRSSESGIAYQIELDENAGSTGSLLGDRMPVSKSATADGRKAEKRRGKKRQDDERKEMVGDINCLPGCDGVSFCTQEIFFSYF